MTLILGRRSRWSHHPIVQSERAGHSQASAGIFKDFLGVWVLGTVSFGFGGGAQKEGAVFPLLRSHTEYS